MQQLSVAVVTEINFDLDGREKCQGENKHLVAVIVNVLSGTGVFCLLGKQSKSPLLRETAQDGGTDSVIWEVPKYTAPVSHSRLGALCVLGQESGLEHDLLTKLGRSL